MIYLDHQATTPLDPEVLEAMRPYLGEYFGNPHSAEHMVGWRASQAVDRATDEVATLIGADADEIIFTSGATEANNLALLGVVGRANHGARNRVLIAATEHKCVLELGRVLERRFAIKVTILPVGRDGVVDLEVLSAELGEDVLLVSIMAVNNEIGTLQDISKIAQMTSQFGCLFHCDAAQGPCAMDMSQLAKVADLVSLSAHKMYGPMGIGALYIRRELQGSVEPLIYGGGQQNGLRSCTLPTALCVGMGRAAKIASNENAAIERASVRQLRDLLLDKLLKLPCSTWVNGPRNMQFRHPGNINIGFSGVQAADLLGRIQPHLAASTGSACTSGIPEPSHVLRAIGLSDEEAAASIRLSIGKNITEDEIETTVSVFEGAIEKIFSDETSILP